MSDKAAADILNPKHQQFPIFAPQENGLPQESQTSESGAFIRVFRRGSDDI
jgi:hypothetical protein